MLFSFECPGIQLERYDFFNDYYFTLPLLLKDPIYLEFMKKTTKYTILDNGVYESGIPEVDDLLRMARMIKADEVVLPDYMNDEKKTLEILDSFISSMSDNEKKEFKWMIVPHADSISNWIEAYPRFCDRYADVIHSIGVPKCLTLCEPQGIHNRVVAIQMVREKGYYLDVPHHALGLKDPCEIKFMTFLRSLDTKWPFKVEGYEKIIKRMKLLKSME